MEKSLQLIVDLAKHFNWTIRMNSIPKAAAWVEIQMEREETQLRPGCSPKNSLDTWKLPFAGWILASSTTEAHRRGRGCSEPFLTGLTGFLGCQCQSSPPKPQNSIQWIHITTAPPALRDFSLTPNKPKIFVKRLKLDPNLALIHSGHVAARRSSDKFSYKILPQRARI